MAPRKPRTPSKPPLGRDADGYLYDAFISYPQAGSVPEWVCDVIEPVLRKQLTDVLGVPSRLYLDVKSEKPGNKWPKNMADAHCTSRVIIPVLCAAYFRSGWCLAEWRTATRREQLIRSRRRPDPKVVIPVWYNDRKPENLAHLQKGLRDEILASSYQDFRPFNRLVKANVATDSNMQAAFDFRDAVDKLCDVIREASTAAPRCSPRWPRLPEEPISGQDPRWRVKL